MATVTTTPIRTFVSGETVTPAKLNELSTPTISVSSIVNADIDASAAIAASKLALTGAIGATQLGTGAITGQTAIDALADGDTLLIHDDSTSALRKVTWSQVLSAAQPSGSILQVQSSVTSIAGNLASTTIADSGITSVSITRTTTTSKILLEVTGGQARSGGYSLETYFYVSHNSGAYADAGGGVVEYIFHSGGTGWHAHVARYVYTPTSTVTSVAAKVYYKIQNGGPYWHEGGGPPFVFTLTEIKA
jgi:hypothetical protein